EPGIDPREGKQVVIGQAKAYRIRHVPHSLGNRGPQMVAYPVYRVLPINAVRNATIQAFPRGEPVHVQLHRTNGLLQRLFKGPSNRHHFAHRFHLRRQGGIGSSKLLEGKTRDLHHHIIDRGFKGGFRHTGNVVGDFIQRVTHGKLRGNLGDGKSSRFRSKRGAPRYTRVHFDDDHVAVLRIQAELDIRSAGIDADLTHDPNGGIPHALVLFVRERHGRRYRDAVTRVHSHRVQIFNRTHNHHIVFEIPHHLKFIFFPPDQGFFDQELTDWTHRQAPIDNLLKLFPVVRDVSAGPAHGKRWTNDRRKSDLFENLDGAFTAMCRAAGRHSQPNPLHGMFERFAILGLINRLSRRTDQLDL